MIVPDVNLLLYAEIDAYPCHPAAKLWWEAVLNGDRPIGIAPVCLFGFLRISTHRRVFTEPLTVAQALARAERWFQQEPVTFLVAGSRHLELAFRILRQLGTAANLTTDAQIAAHAVEHNGEVYSNDHDFGRFEGVRWVNPLSVEAPTRGARPPIGS